ncbi:MAG: NosD domain-containing protein, partial [Betaproteobacteria bacterium]
MKALLVRVIAAVGLIAWVPVAQADICQFIPVSGQWDLPANWANCTGGNGVPLGTPGPADRAEITGKAAILPAGTFNVGDVYLGAAVIQGAGPANTTLNVVAAGTIAWGSGSYLFKDLTAVFTSSTTIPAANGPLTIDNSQFVLTPPLTTMLADSITVTGAGAKIINGGIFNPSTALTMVAGGSFENSLGAVFSPASPITISGPFLNQGGFFASAGATITLNNAAAFTQSGSAAFIEGNGTIAATAQILTLADGYVDGNITFTLGTLQNSGATIRPGGPGVIGTITINGNYDQAGFVEFDLAAIGNVDQILVSGNANLGGNLHRGAIGTFAPPVGTVLDVLTAGAVTGGFSSGSEQISFDAPRRYLEIISATKVSLQANETVWVVGSSDDVSPTLPSLRNALTRFNAESSGGCINAPYAIHFLLGVSDTTIQPATPLPVISGCPGLLIDGYQQAGAVPNSSATDWNATLVIELKGASCPGCAGIDIFAANTVVKGINFTDWPVAGIRANGSGTRIEGNYFFQGNIGVFHGGSPDLRIGQAGNTAARNVFVHAAQAGIHTTMQSGGLPLRIEDNLIGAGAGLTPGPNAHGITVNGSNGVTLSGNYIANNTKGLAVMGGTGIDYSAINTFVANGIPVDLGDDGPTANDDLSPPYDTDNGANAQLNFPKILSVTPTSVSSANINYELRSNPGSNFNLCFCKNPSGGTQCEVPLTPCQPASTDAGGLYTNTIGILGLSGGTMLTMFTQATSGPKSGNMSEISPGVSFGAPSCGNTEVTSTADSGACTLRAAITYANSNCGLGPHTISFNIAGAGPHSILPLTDLPDITCAATTVDGYTQPGSAPNSSAPVAGNNADLRIILDGSSASLCRGVSVLANNVLVRGLALRSFGCEGLFSSGPNTRFQGNYVGTDPGGLTAFGNGFYGIKVAG